MYIGVAPITQATHVRNKVVHSREVTLCGKSDFTYHTELLFPLREASILKREENEENNCLIQKSPFDMRNFFRVLATLLMFVTSHKKLLNILGLDLSFQGHIGDLNLHCYLLGISY